MDLYCAAYKGAGLYSAAYKGAVDEVELLLQAECCCGVNYSGNYDHNTALYIACAWGRISHFKIITMLIERGADVNKPNAKGQTPLYVAASWGHTHVVKYLIKHGAALNAQNEDGRTPLHVAAVAVPHVNPTPSANDRYPKYAAESKPEMLEHAKAYMEEVMKTGQHAQLLREIESHYKTLVSYPTDLDISDSILDIVVPYNHFATVVELVNAGAELNVRDNRKQTCLTKAKFSQHGPMAKFLGDNGAIE